MLEAYLDDSGDEDIHAVAVGGGTAPRDVWPRAVADWTSTLQDLMRRLAFVERELEKARAKIPRGISTS